MKEILKLSTLITEETFENGVSSKKESYIIEENILENTDKEL